MQIPRIYQALSQPPTNEIQLDERAIRHLVQVLRLREGDPFILFDGQGNGWQASLISVSKKAAAARLASPVTEVTESPLYIHLGLGISRGERMDIAIQKAVELGVNEITPLVTRYSVVKLDEKRRAKRHEHWQGIIISACEQCGRNLLPSLNMAMDNSDWLNTQTDDAKLMLDPRATQGTGEFTQTPEKVRLYIGPEGGFSEEEVEQARQLGFSGMRLGPRILRTETAVISSITAMQLMWGDLK